ncbi:MAG: PTS sugar transporter subunit IIA [Treponema sp.]|nr:PTS sugar transporter subunit IIA [Treponema sp.]
MVGILLVAHGDFAQGMLSAVRLIAGEPEKTIALGLYHGDSPEDFEKKISAAIRKLDDGGGMIAFVDFLGGTPASSLLRVMQDKPFPCFSGVNMPMLAEAVLARVDANLSSGQIAEICSAAGREGQVRLDTLLKGQPENTGTGTT